MKIFLYLIVLNIISIEAFSSGDNFTSGARAAAMGDASVTLSDVFCTTTNQAGLAFLEKYAIGIYTDRKFLNASINNFNLAIAVPVKRIGAFGLSTNFYGYKYYNETKIGLAYARKFSDKISVGVQFDYLRLFVSEVGSRSFFTIEAGIQYKPWKVLTLGAHLYNPIPYKVEKTYGERLPTILKFGLGYEPSPKVLLVAEYEQDIHYKPQFKGGIEYRPVKYFTLRAGVQTTPFSACFGFGFNVIGLRLDVSGSYHPKLGFTPQLSFIYAFDGKKNPKKP